MKITQDKIWKAIRNSAKKRFDYKSLEDSFRETGNPQIAENILEMIILGLESGKTKDHLVSQIQTEMWLIGFGFVNGELEKLIDHKDKELETEILAVRLTLGMLQQECDLGTILNAVQKMLNW